jgi:predicted DNA-binding protein (MmcQ/YjbR family)
MDIEQFRAYCLSLPFVEEYTPFDDVTLCFKVGSIEKGKIFCFLPLGADPPRTGLKCDPDRAIELREKHDQITPGFHLNKKHWNTVFIDDGLSNKVIKELIDHSYELVYNSLTAKFRKELEGE